MEVASSSARLGFGQRPWKIKVFRSFQICHLCQQQELWSEVQPSSCIRRTGAPLFLGVTNRSYISGQFTPTHIIGPSNLCGISFRSLTSRMEGLHLLKDFRSKKASKEHQEEVSSDERMMRKQWCFPWFSPDVGHEDSNSQMGGSSVRVQGEWTLEDLCCQHVWYVVVYKKSDGSSPAKTLFYLLVSVYVVAFLSVFGDKRLCCLKLGGSEC